jgi:hypothetical protein
MILLATTRAVADDAPPPAPGAIPLQVTVGETVEVDVAYARGLRCDDLSIIRADLVTKNDHNFLVVTGLKVGQTQCRAGTSLTVPPWFLFDIHVVAAKKR